MIQIIFFSVAEQDYDVISSDIDITPKKKVTSQTVRTQLVIIKPDLMGDSKWEFYYNTRIKAKIQDKHWKQQFENHEISFTKCSLLDVDLKIDLVFDDNDLPIDNSAEYSIEKVYKIIQPEITEETQTTL